MDLHETLRSQGSACTELSLADMIKLAEDLDLNPSDVSFVGAIFTPAWDHNPPQSVEHERAERHLDIAA